MTTNNKANSSEGSIDNLSFEEALTRLEAIVSEMENNDLPLEKMIERYEQGAKIARICQQRLAEAELKVQELEKKVGSEFTLKSLLMNNEKTDSEHGE